MTIINRDEWLKALAEAGLQDDDDQQAITVGEFAQMCGFKRFVAARKLEELVKAGKAIRTRKRQATPAGKVIAYLAYRLS